MIQALLFTYKKEDYVQKLVFWISKYCRPNLFGGYL